MAYDKHTWTCDEPITVERLNHIEDGIANAGGGECGYECEYESLGTLVDGGYTTVDTYGVNLVDLPTAINADTIDVTFDGVLYEGLSKNSSGFYGASVSLSSQDFSKYPFGIGKNPLTSATALVTPSAGTYTLRVVGFNVDSVDVDACFEEAWKQIANKDLHSGQLDYRIKSSTTINPGTTGQVELELTAGQSVPNNVLVNAILGWKLDVNLTDVVVQGISRLITGVAYVWLRNDGSSAVTVSGNSFTLNTNVLYVE